MNQFANRKYIIGAIFSLIVLIFIFRLFFLQVVDQSSKLSASNNVLRHVSKFPARGLIFDRNNTLLVYNEAAYDLMIIPNLLSEFDTLALCELLDLSIEQVERRIKKAKSYSYYKPSIFEKQISARTYAPLQETLYNYKGFYVQTRSLRRYPKKIAANVLGYVSEVDDKITKSDHFYKSGDYIGAKGVEKSYEEVLRGKKGVEIFMVDVHNRIKGRFKNSKFDTAAVHGGNITLTIDAELQKYGEKLMQNKLGTIVALEPSTGEILALVSSPSYNPELLVGRVRSKNYNILQSDTLMPLFDRPLMGRNPPGSTFKTVNALIGLQEGIIHLNTRYKCLPGYAAGRFYMGCHRHIENPNLIESIQNSCNAYYANEFRTLLDHPKYGSFANAYEVWRNHVLSFGFGKRLGVDLPNEKQGYIPTLNRYNRIYGEGHVRSLNIVSMSIGQGELLMTPMQMANMTAIICNKGYYYTPHIIRTLPKAFEEQKMPFVVRHYTDIDSGYFQPIIEGMFLAVNGDVGTARNAAIRGIELCGKTGTAQNPGKDHSIFIAFAPKDDPKIALAVYVENGGYGSTWAAPIASLLVEMHLSDTVKRGWLENYILEGDLIHAITEE